MRQAWIYWANDLLAAIEEWSLTSGQKLTLSDVLSYPDLDKLWVDGIMAELAAAKVIQHYEK